MCNGATVLIHHKDDGQSGVQQFSLTLRSWLLYRVENFLKIAQFETMADQLRDGLTGLNIDYRSSIAEFPDAMQPIVTTYGLGEGPFAADATRIKQRRIIRPTS